MVGIVVFIILFFFFFSGSIFSDFKILFDSSVNMCFHFSQLLTFFLPLSKRSMFFGVCVVIFFPDEGKLLSRVVIVGF